MNSYSNLPCFFRRPVRLALTSCQLRHTHRWRWGESTDTPSRGYKNTQPAASACIVQELCESRGGLSVLTSLRRQEVIKTLNQQRRLIFSTPHSFDSISCTPSRSNHLQAKLIRFFSVLSFVSLVLPVCSLLFEKGIFAENLRMI